MLSHLKTTLFFSYIVFQLEMQLFLLCYFVLFSLVNTKSTPPPPGVDGADEEDDDGYDH